LQPHPDLFDPSRKDWVLPNYGPVRDQQLSNGINTGVVENNRLVRKSDGVRGTIETAGVAAPYVAIRNVMTAAGNPQTDTFYVQVRIAKGDVYESGTVPSHLCLAHNGHCAMPGKSRFQNESVFRRQSGSTVQNGFTSRSNRRAGGVLRIQPSRDRVGIDQDIASRK
jgi:hypothetical protein